MFNRKNDDNTYKVGLYIRLSREDGDNLESESISNQRTLLHNYIEQHHFHVINEYVDDGYSGGNFDRPGFKRMLKDLEDKKINCIITKDLSRLGRDHIDTGRYIERYFPENNIRYIAVNDDYDTFRESSGSDMMPFRLSMNDIYAKDISKKVRSSLMAMKEEGKFCGSMPSYGYKRDDADKHKLVPDPKTAPVVKKIFELYTLGYGSSMIADILTQDKEPTPVMIKNHTSRLDKTNHPEIWKSSSVNNILKNRVYTGCTIQHIMQNVSYKSKKKKRVPKSEWIVKENTHEPLVDKNTFLLAQSIRNKSNNYEEGRRKVEYILSQMVYCKDCGARMAISYDNKRDRVTMNCSNYRKFSKYGICSSHYMNYTKLEQELYSRIGELSYQYISHREEFEHILKRECKDTKEELLTQIEKAKQEIDNLRRKQDALYDDKFHEVIDVTTYKRLFDRTMSDMDKWNLKMASCQKELESLSKHSYNDKEYVTIIEDYLKIKHPTRDMIQKIVDKIYIGKDKKIEIYYKIKKEDPVII